MAQTLNATKAKNTAGMTVGETHPCVPGPRGVVALDKRTGAAITKAVAKLGF